MTVVEKEEKVAKTKKPIYQQLGLTDEEYQDIIKVLDGREPNDVELAMFSVMWSEHCSYKASRKYLKNFPTNGDHVLVGPGEGAGVIDIGDDMALAIRIESVLLLVLAVFCEIFFLWVHVPSLF